MNHTVEMWLEINIVKNKHKLCYPHSITLPVANHRCHGYLYNNFSQKNIVYDLF